MAQTCKTMLNSSGESGHPYLVSDFRGNAFSFSPLRIMFAVGLSYMAFIMGQLTFDETANDKRIVLSTNDARTTE